MQLACGRVRAVACVGVTTARADGAGATQALALANPDGQIGGFGDGGTDCLVVIGRLDQMFFLFAG